MQNNKKGFVLPAVIVILMVMVGVGLYINSKNQSNEPLSNTEKNSTSTLPQTEADIIQTSNETKIISNEKVVEPNTQINRFDFSNYIPCYGCSPDLTIQTKLSGYSWKKLTEFAGLAEKYKENTNFLSGYAVSDGTGYYIFVKHEPRFGIGCVPSDNSVKTKKYGNVYRLPNNLSYSLLKAVEKFPDDIKVTCPDE